MDAAMSFDLRTLLRGHAPIKLADALRGGAGALLGIAAVGFLARLVHDHAASWVPLIAAPIGASAVLVFAVPASPLAQPRGVIGGNLIGALAGVACGLLIPVPLLAAAVAVGAAIVVMSLLGCLHPPGGAVALGAALAAPAAGPPPCRTPSVSSGSARCCSSQRPCSTRRCPAGRIRTASPRRRTFTPRPTGRHPSGSGSRPPTSTAPWPSTASCWTSAATISTLCSARSNCRRIAASIRGSAVAT
ncbi:hypothetical protein CSW64_01045 [Caulobacter mirabilis]|uniref:HPP transmembrane region domain-containing protein n=1 Tax=Caulobacter mirabilis TaxID=69666 RepID=A0A2D2ASX2_9CAUL|nr:hypothetical protein CSW64_01045 [Caulobacter mirabilis]